MVHEIATDSNEEMVQETVDPFTDSVGGKIELLEETGSLMTLYGRTTLQINIDQNSGSVSIYDEQEGCIFRATGILSLDVVNNS